MCWDCVDASTLQKLRENLCVGITLKGIGELRPVDKERILWTIITGVLPNHCLSGTTASFSPSMEQKTDVSSEALTGNEAHGATEPLSGRATEDNNSRSGTPGNGNEDEQSHDLDFEDRGESLSYGLRSGTTRNGAQGTYSSTSSSATTFVRRKGSQSVSSTEFSGTWRNTEEFSTALKPLDCNASKTLSPQQIQDEDVHAQATVVQGEPVASPSYASGTSFNSDMSAVKIRNQNSNNIDTGRATSTDPNAPRAGPHRQNSTTFQENLPGRVTQLPPKLSLPSFCSQYGLSDNLTIKLNGMRMPGPHALRHIDNQTLLSGGKWSLEMGELAELRDAEERWKESFSLGSGLPQE
ncbi:hypothetical protein L218DRAFT_991912 [Marasmius fiardii PR-910]|nr:hypothetical protein L218DRAFT_991912 [Marasmius fiardii PR-910]